MNLNVFFVILFFPPLIVAVFEKLQDLRLQDFSEYQILINS